MKKFFIVLVALAVLAIALPTVAAEKDILDPIPGDVFGKIKHSYNENGKIAIYDAVDIIQTGVYTYDFAIKVDPNRIPEEYKIVLVGINGDWSCGQKGSINKNGMAVFKDIFVDLGIHGFTVVFRGNGTPPEIWGHVEPTLNTWEFGGDKVKYVVQKTKSNLVGGPLALMKYQEDCPNC